MHSGLYGKSPGRTSAEGKGNITLSNTGAHPHKPGDRLTVCNLVTIAHMATAARTIGCAGCRNRDPLPGPVVGLAGPLGVMAGDRLGQARVAGLDGPDQLPVLVP
jgi:hypothetical protein